MAKIIKYQLSHEKERQILVEKPYYDEETQENYYINELETKIEIELYDKSFICPTQEGFDINLLIAQQEAYNGEYTIEGEFDILEQQNV